ncbi:MAG: hypothetical protein Kow00100_08790 [Geothermobacteraceae bacterium]
MRGLISFLVVLPFLAGCAVSSYDVSGRIHNDHVRTRVIVTAPPPPVVVQKRVVVAPPPVIVRKKVVVTPPPVVRKRVVVVSPRVVHKKVVVKPPKVVHKKVVVTPPPVVKKRIVVRPPVERKKIIVRKPGTVSSPKLRQRPEPRRHPVEVVRQEKEHRHHGRYDDDDHHQRAEKKQLAFRQLELRPEGSLRVKGRRVKITGQRVVVRPGQTTRMMLRAGNRTLPVWVRFRDNRIEFAGSKSFARGRIAHTVQPSWKAGGRLSLRFDGADIQMRVRLAG